MKKINFLLLFVLVFHFISCDKAKNSDKEEIQQKKNMFTIEINAIINEKDVICLYYKDNTISFFNEEMSIYKNIEKSNVPQTITFELPENFIPNDFRFDLSHVNPNQTMIVNSIKFSFEGEEFEINNVDLEKYFTNNEGVIFNEADRSFSFQKTKDGNYDPFLTTTGQFYPLLEKLVGIGAFQPPVNLKK